MARCCLWDSLRQAPRPCPFHLLPAQGRGQVVLLHAQAVAQEKAVLQDGACVPGQPVVKHLAVTRGPQAVLYRLRSRIDPP